MFQIVSVILENFRSFIGTHEWVLDEKSGLYFLTGINYENVRLGRNGVGKSSLLDAICWCLYGKSTQGLRGSDIVSRGCSTARVVVDLIVDGENYQITRIQGQPNWLIMGHKTVSQDEVTKALRLNFESFLYSFIMPQGGDSFLELSPGKKLDLFSQIMDLDYWIECSDKAAKKAKRIENEKITVESALSRLAGTVASITVTINELKAKSKEFDAQKREDVRQLSEKCGILLTRKQSLTAELKAINPPSEKQLELFERDIKAYESNERELADAHLKAMQEYSRITTEINHLNTEAETLASLGARCPTCKQRIDEDHVAKYRTQTVAKRVGLKDSLDEVTELIKEIKTNKSTIATAVATQETALRKLQTEAREAERNRNSIQSEINYLNNGITEIKDEIAKVNLRFNDFEQLLEMKQRELLIANGSIEIKKADIAKLNEDYAAAHYWVTGFRKLRLHVIEEALASLEVEVNNNLTALGLGDWKIEFDIERENKSGGITKGFVTLVTDPKDFIAPYETISFGENQRFRLAGAFGLADLIIERAGLVSKFEAYDEITQHMSVEGIEDTLNLLRDRAITKEKVIYLIDHQVHDYGDFSRTINLIKDKNGSRFA